MSGKGILCPTCGCAASQVIDSRAREQKLRRRRMCKACGHKFITIESYFVKEPTNKHLVSLLDKVADMNQRMASLLKKGVVPSGRGQIFFTREMDTALRDGIKSGHSQAVIAATIGVSPTVIHRRAFELGLESNKPWAAKRAKLAKRRNQVTEIER